MANLVKKLGFWSIVLYGINSIIGTGIFLTPGGVIKVAGNICTNIIFNSSSICNYLSNSICNGSKIC